MEKPNQFKNRDNKNRSQEFRNEWRAIQVQYEFFDWDEQVHALHCIGNTHVLLLIDSTPTKIRVYPKNIPFSVVLHKVSLWGKDLHTNHQNKQCLFD